MKTIKILVEIGVPDDYCVDDPELVLENAASIYFHEINIIDAEFIK